MGLIYCLTSPSGKKYVGKTDRDLDTRVKEHVWHAKAKRRAICHAINKYGIDNFLVETLCDEVDDPELLAILEQEYIAKLKQDGDTLYNHTDGGEGIPGLVVSDATKTKISKKVKKRWESSEYRAHMSEALVWKDENRRVAFIESNKAMHKDPQYKEKLMAGLRSYLDKPETKTLQREKVLGAKNPMAKYSVEKVLEIQSLVNSGMTQRKAGEIAGVCYKVVSRIMTGKSWSHITGIEKRGKSSDITIPKPGKTEQDH